MKPVTTQSEDRSAATEPRAPTLRNYYGGSWEAAAATKSLEDRDPVSGEVAALVPLSGPAEVDAAVTAARAAQAAWREVPPQRRARAIMRLRSELDQRRE